MNSSKQTRVQVIKLLIFTILLTITGNTLKVSAAEFIVKPVVIDDLKAVFGRVESRNLLAARARIGGTVVEIAVEEGTAVNAGQTVALVTDEKLALKLDALDAGLKALSAQLDNTISELKRGQKLFSEGLIPKSRFDQLQTQANVLANQVKARQADRSVLVQQTAEGKVLAPAAGRVLTVPLTLGSVVLPGETIATIAGGGYFLRLAVPERHAALIKMGDAVIVGKRGLTATPNGQKQAAAKGRIVKVYPQMENGRIIADVEVEGLGGYFVGERILVWLAVAKQRILAIPPDAVTTRAGIDYVTIATIKEPSTVVILPGRRFETKNGPRIEVLSGLVAGDKVIVP